MTTKPGLMLAAGLLLLSFSAFPVFAADNDPLNPKTEVIPKTKHVEPASVEEPENPEADEPGHHGILGHVLLYLPNRLLDALDVFRARAKVGPGLAFGVRATEVVQANLASYATIYAGLPGPRRRRIPKSPIGLDVYVGACLSVLEAEVGRFGPDYSSTEFGVNAHLFLFGIDLGIDPYEAVDFLGGLFFLDLIDDDL